MVQSLTLRLETGGTRPAHLALPDGDGPFPGVVVLHDVYGVKPDVFRHLRRFAGDGYAAIAPDLYDGGKVGCIVSTLVAMQRGHGAALVAIEAARRALADRADVDEGRIAVMGFCMGGGFAILAAADHAFAVAAPFYGPSPAKAQRLEGMCPTLAQYGERDRSFRAHAKRLKRHLEVLDVPHEVITHPGVGHSFMNDHGFALAKLGRHLPLRAAYDEATEALAWSKMIAFFDTHLGAPAPPTEAA